MSIMFARAKGQTFAIYMYIKALESLFFEIKVLALPQQLSPR